jgi:outer membrane protein assembly factor BamB
MTAARLWVILACLAVSGTASGQAQKLPGEKELAVHGLMRAWWGRATLDPTQDHVKFFTADEQAVYIQSETGGITAFDAENGRRMWARQLGTTQQEGFTVTSNDTEVVATIGMKLFCLDKASGATKWTIDLPHHPAAATGLDDHQAYIPMTDGSVYSYNLDIIHKLSDAGRLPQWSLLARGWRYQTPRSVLSPPASDGNLVTFASSNGTVYAVNAEGVKLKFQFEASAPITTQVAYKGDTIYICDVAARLYCISAVTGITRWTFATGDPVRQQPRPVEDAVFVVGQRAGLYCIDAVTGLERWPTRNTVVSEFISVSNTHVYAADVLNNLMILSRETGKTEASIPMRNFPLRVNNARTDRMYLASPDGVVICLREADQKLPIYHLYPDRSPILPELAPEEGEEMPAEKPAEAPAPTN